MATDTSSENPWENAASDPMWAESQQQQEQRQTINFSLEQNGPDDTFGTQDEEIEEESASKLVRYLVNSWHVTDATVGLTMAIYGAVLSTSTSTSTSSAQQPQQLPKALVGSLVILGALSMLRASAGLYSIYKDAFGRMGMLLSAYMSVVWSFLLFVLSMVSLGFRNKIPSYLKDHQKQLHLNDTIVGFFERHIHFVWITLLVLCVLEGLRWISLVNYRAFMLEEDELALQLLPQSPSRRQHKPWWWSKSNRSDDEMADPLLGGGPSWATTNNRSYQMDEGLGTNSNDSMWSALFGKRSSTNGGNARDDTSVDFASVQEEWASRSEEDPFWWSREEGERKTNS